MMPCPVQEMVMRPLAALAVWLLVVAAPASAQLTLFEHDNFGGAGKVSGDLVDDAFLTPACH